MPIYFAIKDSETGPTLYVDIDEAKGVLDSMVENKADRDDTEQYSFEAVEMSKEEFRALPDFNGF